MILSRFVLLLALLPLGADATEYLTTSDPPVRLVSATANNGISSIKSYGQAVEDVLCDQIVFTVRFKTEGEQNDDALENARTKMANTQKQVLQHGYTLVAAALTDIKLSRNSQSRMTGYVQYEIVVGEFTDPLLLMSQVIGADVDQVSQLSYRLADPSRAIARLKEKALEKATEAARTQALKAGVELEELIDVQFQDLKPNRPNHPMRKIRVSATALFAVSGPYRR